jgi:hypothetical protein
MSLHSKLVDLIIAQQRQLVDLLSTHQQQDIDRSAPAPKEEPPGPRIARYVRDEVRAGRVRPENAKHLERALRDEAEGRCIIMRKPPRVARRWPRSPEEARAGRGTAWWEVD